MILDLNWYPHVESSKSEYIFSKPVEDKKIKSQLSPWKISNHGSIERFLEGKHPGSLRYSKVEPMTIAIPAGNDKEASNGQFVMNGRSIKY